MEIEPHCKFSREARLHRAKENEGSCTPSLVYYTISQDVNPLRHLGMARGDGECACGGRTWSRSGTSLLDYKKEYLNLFSSNNHEQVYRPGCWYFNSLYAHLSRLRLSQRHLRSLLWVWVWAWDWIHSHTPPRTRSPSSRHPPFKLERKPLGHLGMAI